MAHENEARGLDANAQKYERQTPRGLDFLGALYQLVAAAAREGREAFADGVDLLLEGLVHLHACRGVTGRDGAGECGGVGEEMA